MADAAALHVCAITRNIIRRARCPHYRIRTSRSRVAVGKGSDDLDLHQPTARNLLRLPESVGLERRPRQLESLEKSLAPDRVSTL
jgi:hypothetical protein